MATYNSKIKVGARVRYAARFLKSIGETTGDMPFMQGTVLSMIPLGSSSNALCVVQFDKIGEMKVLASNLFPVPIPGWTLTPEGYVDLRPSGSLELLD